MIFILFYFLVLYPSTKAFYCVILYALLDSLYMASFFWNYEFLEYLELELGV